MTVEVERDALLGALQRVVSVVESRNTIAILANLLIEVAEGSMTITGTDLDLQVSATVDAKGDLKTTVDAQKMLAAITSFAPGKLVIAPVDGRAAITIKRGRGVRTLSTLPATDFPKQGALENATSFVLPAPTLLRLLDTASVAQSNDETRYYLNGVYLHVVDGKLTGAATDGHRLVRCQISAPDDAIDMRGIIFPTKAVTLTRKLLGKVESEVAFASNSSAFTLKVGETLIVGKLIDGVFPDYARLIPQLGKHAFLGLRDAIIGPASAVSAVVNAEGEAKVKVRTVTFDSNGNEAEAAAQDSTGASAREPLDVEVSGGAIRFGVNHRYLISTASIFSESGKLTLSIADPATPMLLTGDKDPDLVAIIMPMRV